MYSPRPTSSNYPCPRSTSLSAPMVKFHHHNTPRPPALLFSKSRIRSTTRRNTFSTGSALSTSSSLLLACRMYNFHKRFPWPALRIGSHKLFESAIIREMSFLIPCLPQRKRIEYKGCIKTSARDQPQNSCKTSTSSWTTTGTQPNRKTKKNTSNPTHQCLKSSAAEPFHALLSLSTSAFCAPAAFWKPPSSMHSAS